MNRWGPGRPKHVTASQRQACLRRDDWTCQACGYRGQRDGRDLIADHIVNLAAGGARTLENLQTLCHRCSGIKTQAEARAGRRRHKRARPIHPADLL
jgi:5-methylcytosine-specific restriction enzyme A